MREIFSLSGKRILVTGASAGIGREICRTIADLGASVLATARRRDELAETITGLSGEGHRFIAGDLTDPTVRTRLVAEIAAVDGFVNAAGALAVRPFAFSDSKTLRRLQEINFEAPVMLVQQLLKERKINDGGSLVFVTSIAASEGAKGHALYAASKAALTAAARSLALELGGRRIRVNCLAPGMVATAMAGAAEDALSSEAMRVHEREYPLGFGQAEDVAAAAAFLLAAASRWITGTTLTIDGGFSAR